LRRIDTTPLPCLGSSVIVLRSSKTRSDPSIGLTSSSSRRAAGFLDRLARQGRRQQHVVHADRTAPAFAFFLGRREQHQRPAVRDEQPAFNVGEQNRVAHRVDDAVQQPAFAALAAIPFRERILPENLVEFLRQNGREPVQVRAHRGVDGEEQRTERLLGESRQPERHEMKRRVPERRGGTPFAIGRGMRCGKEHRPAFDDRRHQRIVPVVQRHRKRCRPLHTVRANDHERGVGNRPHKTE
jgi:hypothetical protein